MSEASRPSTVSNSLALVLFVVLEVVEADESAERRRCETDKHAKQLLDHLVDERLRWILQCEEEDVLARAAKVDSFDGDKDEAVVGDELDRLAQAVEAAMRAFNDQLDQVVLLLLVLGGVVNEPHDELKQLHNCDDGGAKDHRAQVATHHGPQSVKQPAEAGARATLLLAAAGRVGAHVPVGDGVRHGGIRSRTNQLDRPQNAVDVRRHEKCLETDGA
eukprot:6173474-Pleurochrysis_carterae.AAC.7